MEFVISLRRVSGDTLPINYQYPLSAWIYRVIARADEEYAGFLHDSGHWVDGKKFKLFTFSNLSFLPFKIHGDRIRMEGDEASLIVRFFVDRSMEAFIRGLFMTEKFGLGDRKSQVDFEVVQVEGRAAPAFTARMAYRCLTPICVSVHGRGKYAQYLHPEHKDYGKLLVNNLLQKQKAMALPRVSTDMGDAVVNADFGFFGSPKSRLITVRAGNWAETRVRGYTFNFEITLPEELHELGYYAGFGEKNSLGFGCVEVIPRKV